MGLKVIGAGFGRTGTLSLKKALEILGYGPCYHMSELTRNSWPLKIFGVDHEMYWHDLSFKDRLTSFDFEMVFADYKSSTDWPGCSYWQQILSHYPDAKVILTIRDPQSWYISCQDTIFRMHRINPNRPLILKFIHMFTNIGKCGDRIAIDHDLGNDLSRDNCIKRFLDHIENVKKLCPPKKLLIYEVSKGWAPLCEFLGEPIPDIPFPKSNDFYDFWVTVYSIMFMGISLFISLIVGVVLLLYIFIG